MKSSRDHPGSASPLEAATKPTDRLWQRLRKALLAILILITGLVLFYAVENYRGWRAWKAEEARLRRAGEPLTWQELLPPVPSSEENLAAAPIYARIFDALEGRVSAPGATSRIEAMEFFRRQALIELAPPGYKSRLPEISTWMRGELVDVDAWAEHFRTPERPEQVRQRFPLAPEGSPAAEHVLAALSLYEERFRQIEEAARRPRAWFPVRYEENINALLPHASVLRNHVTALVLRGVCHLRLGHGVEAFRDWQTARRLVAALEQEPLLVSQFVRMSLHSLSMQIAWEAMAQHAWDLEKWQSVQQELGRLDFITSLHQALRGERIMVLHTLEVARRDSSILFDFLVSDSADAPMWMDLAHWLPGGWFRQNMVRLSRYYSSVTGAVPSSHPLKVEWVTLGELDQQAKQGSRAPYRLLFHTLAPSALNIVERSLAAQAMAHLGGTAAVLEQYRLQHGQYPAGPDPLGGEKPWTRDPFDAQPLRYQRPGPASFVLYSVGPDRRDDGADVQRPGGSRWPKDLVWRTPAASVEKPASPTPP